MDEDTDAKLKVLKRYIDNLQREREQIAEAHGHEAGRLHDACHENMRELGLAGLIANILGAPLMHLKNKCASHFADAARAKAQDEALKRINALLSSPAPYPQPV